MSVPTRFELNPRHIQDEIDAVEEALKDEDLSEYWRTNLESTLSALKETLDEE